MNETSRNIVDGFRTLREFCRQVALLLTTADTLMQERGWESRLGSRALGYQSKSIKEPKFWLPSFFGRFYKTQKYAHLLPFISVLIENLKNPKLINEAMITAGWVDYGVGNKCGVWKPWFCRWHLWMTDREDDGQLHKQDPRKEWKRWSKSVPEGVVEGVTFGYPLDVIVSAQALEEKIVERLDRELNTPSH